MSRLSCPLETSRLEPGKRRESRPEARGQRGERAFVWPKPSSQSRCRTHRGGQWTLIPLLCSAARTEGPATSETGEKTASCTGDPRGIGAFPKSSRGKETGDRMAEKLTRNQRDGRAGLHRHQGAVVCPRPGHPPPGGWGREPRVTPPGSAELCLQDSAAWREAWKPAFRFARPHGF